MGHAKTKEQQQKIPTALRNICGTRCCLPLKIYYIAFLNFKVI